jgi:hypothetical protein
MRFAMGVRDAGCTAEGCETRPHHHRRIHDPSYEATRLAGGKVSFHRRT